MSEQQMAAAARAGDGGRYTTRANRPICRRMGEDPVSAARVTTRARPVLRAARAAAASPAGLEFAGLACATGQGYEMWDWAGPYTEVVVAGAFAASLTRVDLDVPLVLQHVDLRRLARTTVPAGELGHLQLAENDEGLTCSARLDPADPDVAYIVPKIRAGLVDEMSFKFRIEAGAWSPDWSEYHIERVDVHRGDVAICGYGANPNTSAAVRAPALGELLARAGDAEAREAFAALAARLGPVRRAFMVLDADLV